MLVCWIQYYDQIRGVLSLINGHILMTRASTYLQYIPWVLPKHYHYNRLKTYPTLTGLDTLQNISNGFCQHHHSSHMFLLVHQDFMFFGDRYSHNRGAVAFLCWVCDIVYHTFVLLDCLPPGKCPTHFTFYTACARHVMFGSPRRKRGCGGTERGEGSLLVGRGLACWIWGQNLPVDLSAQLSRVTPSPPATPKGVPAWNHMKLSQPFLDACTNPMNKNTWLRKAVSSTLFWWAGEILPFFHTMFFIQKPFVDGRKYPLQKENDTKSYKKCTPTIVAAFSKNKQLQPFKMIPFRNRSKPRRFRPPVITGRWSCYHWWEPWTLRDRLVSGFQGAFR